MESKPPVPLDYAKPDLQPKTRWVRVQGICALVLIGWGITYLIFAAFLMPAAIAEGDRRMTLMLGGLYLALSVPELALGIWLHRRVRRRQ